MGAAANRAAPRRVLLFSGHIVDAPDRPVPRFPPTRQAEAARRIGDALDALDASAGDIGLSQAAAGGDLLFIEACQRRGVAGLLLLPFDEARFARGSIAVASDGPRWRERFEAVKAASPAPTIRIMADELGPCPDGVDPYERCNLWLLSTAFGLGVDETTLVCLWDGGGGDGPGGTRHMVDEFRRRNQRVVWIDARTL